MCKFGDYDDEISVYSFSLIGKGNTIDNLIISKLVHPSLQDDDG
jgi:hypothetical protein